MEQRSSLHSDVENIKERITEIKVDIRDLRIKVDAANDAIARINERITTEVAKARAELRQEIADARDDMAKGFGVLQERIADTREEMVKGFGVQSANLAKVAGDCSTALEKAKFAMVMLWITVTFAGVGMLGTIFMIVSGLMRKG